MFTAIVVAGIAVALWKPSSRSPIEKKSTARTTQVHAEGQSPRDRRLDPARYQRLAARLLGMPGESTMTEAARDGESSFHRMVDSFSSDDFAGVLAELASLEGQGKDPAIAELRLKLLQAWTEKDPSAAASFALGGTIPADACRVIAETWAKHDSTASLIWARQLPEGGRRQAALIGTGNHLASDNPKQAIELAQEAGASPAAEELLGQATGIWAAKDPQAALSWASGMKDPSLKDKLITAAAMSLSDQDPTAAAGLVIDAVNSDSLTENAVVGIVQRLAFKDMAQAHEWVAEFPEGRMRERAEMELARITERTGAKRP
ncbi:hypothetical protein [Haloferula sp. BvORR071]|uniref:hypothetical protein n=1 Tax=Haloferula sp. BvORR071 TaxID=1396141 RepID=UPI002241043C|nr:hypothetical protein [Haloferula sp. BvORR071]